MSAVSPPSLRIIKAALVDLNGTLHIGNQPIPHSIAALKRLRDAGILVGCFFRYHYHAITHIQVRFVSNTSKDTTAALVKQVQTIGFDIDPSHVFTSIGAARALVAQRRLRPLLLLQPQAAAEFASLPLEPPHNAVVVGLAKDGFNYQNMNQVLSWDPWLPHCTALLQRNNPHAGIAGIAGQPGRTTHCHAQGAALPGPFRGPATGPRALCGRPRIRNRQGCRGALIVINVIHSCVGIIIIPAPGAIVTVAPHSHQR